MLQHSKDYYCEVLLSAISYMIIITHIAVIFTLNAVEYNSHGNAGLHLYH
jgi:hypothetical protein